MIAESWRCRDDGLVIVTWIGIALTILDAAWLVTNLHGIPPLDNRGLKCCPGLSDLMSGSYNPIFGVATLFGIAGEG